MSFLVTAFNLVSGQYKKIFDKTFTNFCKTIWDPAIKDYYNKHCVPFTNIPKFGTCPWPKVGLKEFVKTIIAYRTFVG